MVPWVETDPLGTAPANTIDTIIQDLKKSIRERMDSVLTVAFGADPILLKPTVGGNGFKTIAIHASAFLPDNPSNLNQIQAQGPLTGAVRIWVAPLILPPGAIITKLEAGAIPVNTSPICFLGRVDLLVGGPIVAIAGTNVGFPAPGGAVYGLYASGGPGVVVDAGFAYAVVWNALNAANSLSGVRVTYQVQNNLQTL